jgi:hypothetical protein
MRADFAAAGNLLLKRPVGIIGRQAGNNIQV